MPPITRRADKECWLGVYESSYFSGKLRRFFGPTELPRLSGGSVIVGPKAKVQVVARRGQKVVMIDLKPNRVIADLTLSLRGAQIHSASVFHPSKSALFAPKSRRQ
jgi:hypothetical protein